MYLNLLIIFLLILIIIIYVIFKISARKMQPENIETFQVGKRIPASRPWIYIPFPEKRIPTGDPGTFGTQNASHYLPIKAAWY